MRLALSAATLFLFFFPATLPAPYVWKNGWFHDKKYEATSSLDEHWKMGLQAIQNKQWEEAEVQFKIVLNNFPESSLAKEAQYYLGVALYNLDEYDLANERFTEYLSQENNPQFYEEVFQFKLEIAQKFKNGALRHAFGSEKMPKLMSGKEIALTIFDEISTSLPNHELAAIALREKAEMQKEEEEFGEAIETYQTLIRRFPKSQYAIAGYQGMTQVYLKQLKLEANNPDPLPLAEMNIQKFISEFPNEATAQESLATLSQMKEISAQGLYDIGNFYERTNKPSAAILYYTMTITRFPDTEVAKQCQERLKELKANESPSTT